MRTGTADKRSLAGEKAEFNVGFHWRDIQGPLRAMVREARTRNHTKESLKSRIIRGRREITNGGGVLGMGVKAGAGETVARELGFRYGEFTLAQAYRQAMGTAQLQYVFEMLNMRR